MKKLLIILVSISFVAPAQMTDEILAIQKQWAVVNYQVVEDEKEDAFEKLSKVATQLVLDNPKNVHALVWEGIINSTYAGVAGALTAGRLAKLSRKSFEAAITMDDTVMDGSAYTSLGVLYFKVPGWPLSFGNDKKAMKYLKKGLALNPDGIVSNYFYAEFLFEEEGEYQLAKVHALKAQNAEPRPTRPLADSGRQADVKVLMGKIDEELSD